MSQAQITTLVGRLVEEAYAAQDKLRENPSIETALLACAAEQAALDAVNPGWKEVGQ